VFLAVPPASFVPVAVGLAETARAVQKVVVPFSRIYRSVSKDLCSLSAFFAVYVRAYFYI